MSKKRRRGGLIFFLIVLAGVSVAGYGAGPGKWFRGDEVAAIEGVPVRRGPLRISELVRGNLEAKNSISVRSEIDREVTILKLAPQGAIEQGALVAELDVADLEERRVVQEIDLKKAEADFIKATEQYGIQEIQNQTDVAEAELALEFAKLDLEKYLAEDKGEWQHELAQSEEAIALAQEELKSADEELKWTRELALKGFAQANEVEQDELVYQRREIALKQAEREKALLLEYGHRRKSAELEADVETKERDVQKVGKQAVARLADFESEREAAKFKLAREQEKLDKLVEQISKAKIYAPESGILVYARRKSRWGSGDPVEEGGTVYRSQEIATIPRAGGMTAQASLHETKLKKVRAGQRCLVQVEALPGKTFEGRVVSVAILPESGGWMTDPNQRLYPAEITILDGVPDMRPGMSCGIEILIDDLEDVLYVPRQCVFLDAGQTVCFVRGADATEKRVVEVGLDNAKWVQIVSGVSEGETVLLSPPASFQPGREIDPQGGEDLPDWDPEANVSVTPSGSSDDLEGVAGPATARLEGAADEGADSGASGFEGLDAEARRERFQNMTEEERAALMQQFRERGGAGAAGGAGGEGRRGGAGAGRGEGRRRGGGGDASGGGSGGGSSPRGGGDEKE